MKKRLQERMFDLIAERAKTANTEKRAQLTREIEKIADMLKGM